MPKEIKAIKCPHCGSVKHTAIKPDQYRCESCHTQYFIDSDDVHVYHTVTHRTEGGYQYKAPQIPKKMIVFGAIVSAAMFFVAIFFFIGNDSSAGSTYSVSEASAPKETYTTWSGGTAPVLSSAGEPLLFSLAGRMYRGTAGSDDKNGLYAAFFDPIKKEEVSAKKLDLPNAGTTADVKLRQFTNGDMYAIINKSKIFKIDPAAQSATDVSSSLYKDQPLLQSGIATVEFMYDSYGDGLTVMTNDGKSLFYYPLVNKVYTKTELDKAQEGFSTLLPGATDRTYFTFTRKGHEFPDEKTQLLQIVHKHNSGGPRWLVTGPSWGKDYQVPSGIYSGNIPYKKVLLSKREMERGRIVSYKDITPDRLYFSPEVLFSDDKDLVILFRANASPETPFTLQCLDPNTGTIKWTTPLEAKQDIDEMIRCKEGFLGTSYRDGLVFNASGKLVSHHEIK
ncbi:hypothetical protein MKQ68_24965 [Chitinophaga horti]|uniref:C2H2-type domain-containing protein n=1 Tax=Chitinophaga horti TaxID=2920382 RepID=A0ABY6J0Y3_9BACT|nr:hypothetical protein [Chitinophaga horti]UYQ93338.1 hypothetical protein MKQ68_24965 [Chitinophaga horti]